MFWVIAILTMFVGVIIALTPNRREADARVLVHHHMLGSSIAVIATNELGHWWSDGSTGVTGKRSVIQVVSLVPGLHRRGNAPVVLGCSLGKRSPWVAQPSPSSY